MPLITVVKPFILTLNPVQVGTAPNEQGKEMPVFAEPERLQFSPGVYDVTDDIAGHWYVQPHLQGYQPPPPQQGTAQYAQQAVLAAQGVRMMNPMAGSIPPPPQTLPATPQPQVAGQSMNAPLPEGATVFAGPVQVAQPPAPPSAVNWAWSGPPARPEA